MRPAKYNPENWSQDLPDGEAKSTKRNLARGNRSKQTMKGKGRRSFEITCLGKNGKVMVHA